SGAPQERREIVEEQCETSGKPGSVDNQHFRVWPCSEQRTRQRLFRGDTQMLEAFVFGETSDHREDLGDVRRRRGTNDCIHQATAVAAACAWTRPSTRRPMIT